VAFPLFLLLTGEASFGLPAQHLLAQGPVIWRYFRLVVIPSGEIPACLPAGAPGVTWRAYKTQSLSEPC
jgi:hypothetical protein